MQRYSYYEDIRKFRRNQKNKKAQPRNRSCASHYYNNAVKADAKPKKIPGAFAAANGKSRSGLNNP